MGLRGSVVAGKKELREEGRLEDIQNFAERSNNLIPLKLP
jgi:hypothetical protein